MRKREAGASETESVVAGEQSGGAIEAEGVVQDPAIAAAAEVVGSEHRGEGEGDLGRLIESGIRFREPIFHCIDRVLILSGQIVLRQFDPFANHPGFHAKCVAGVGVREKFFAAVIARVVLHGTGLWGLSNAGQSMVDERRRDSVFL